MSDVRAEVEATRNPHPSSAFYAAELLGHALKHAKEEEAKERPNWPFAFGCLKTGTILALAELKKEIERELVRDEDDRLEAREAELRQADRRRDDVEESAREGRHNDATEHGL